MNWYAVYTKPRQERIALENLERQSFETYLPLIGSKRKRGGKWVELVEPMFSRYLFIRFESGKTSVASVGSTRGVSGLVKFGNTVVPVPESLVSLLMQTADPGTGVHTPELDLLREGDPVVLTDGPLANIQAIFRAADGDARAIVLLRLLGRETEVAVSQNQISRPV